MPRNASPIRPLLFTIPLIGFGLSPDGVGPRIGVHVREALRCELMSKVDYDRMERGYYEHVLDAGRLAALPAEICQEVADLRGVVLRPNLTTVLPVGAIWLTNALGMRDRPYSREKLPGTFRIALAGDSIGVGLGVDDGVGFESILERTLDKQSRQRGGPKVEILNFCGPGRSPGQRWYHFAKVAWAMSPDVVVFEATQADVGWDVRRLAALLPRGIGWDASMYRNTLARSGLRPGQTREDYEQALTRYSWDLLAEVYKAVASDCRLRGLPCVWVLIPRVGRTVAAEDHRRLLAVARDAGFPLIVDISDAYDGLDPADLAIQPSDYHPNATGHALLARRLEESLK